MTWKQHVVVLSPSGGLWMRQHKRGGCLMMMWALQHYISIALYHPGSSDGLFALCLCLSVCFCVLAVTTQVQMLRASLSEASGIIYSQQYACTVQNLTLVSRRMVYLTWPAVWLGVNLLEFLIYNIWELGLAKLFIRAYEHGDFFNWKAYLVKNKSW